MSRVLFSAASCERRTVRTVLVPLCIAPHSSTVRVKFFWVTVVPFYLVLSFAILYSYFVWPHDRIQVLSGPAIESMWYCDITFLFTNVLFTTYIHKTLSDFLTVGCYISLVNKSLSIKYYSENVALRDGYNELMVIYFHLLCVIMNLFSLKKQWTEET